MKVSHLFFLHTILEYVLNNQATCLTQSHFMPHAAKGLIHFYHDLWRLAVPTELEQLLPDMACIAMNDRLWNPAEELVNHDSFMLLRNTVKGLLDNMTPKGVHAQIQSVASYRIGDCNDLLGSPMFETTLNKKIAKPVYHEWVSLTDDGLDDVVLLLCCPNLEFLLEEDRCLLVVIANNFVHNVFPVARDIFVQETFVIEGLVR